MLDMQAGALEPPLIRTRLALISLPEAQPEAAGGAVMTLSDSESLLPVPVVTSTSAEWMGLAGLIEEKEHDGIECSNLVELQPPEPQC